jgi:hypothetical protein
VFEPEIEVHARRSMFLHAEPLAVGQEIPGRTLLVRASDRVPAGLGRLFEIALSAVLFQSTFSHVRDLFDEMPSAWRGQCPSHR